MGQTRKVMVKFRDASRAVQAAKRLVLQVGRDAVKRARPLFPDETEAELASLYELDLSPQASLTKVLKDLRGDEDVEYAHVPEERFPRV